MSYINFFPGSMQSERGISVDPISAYATAGDLGDFLQSILFGCTASISEDGIKDALEDGELLGIIQNQYGFSDQELTEVVDELRSAL